MKTRLEYDKVDGRAVVDMEPTISRSPVVSKTIGKDIDLE